MDAVFIPYERDRPAQLLTKVADEYCYQRAVGIGIIPK